MLSKFNTIILKNRSKILTLKTRRHEQLIILQKTKRTEQAEAAAAFADDGSRPYPESQRI